MELARDGGDVLKLTFRQTEQVPLFDEDENGNRNGFMLLASALFDLLKNSPFGNGGELSLEDPTAHDRCKSLMISYK